MTETTPPETPPATPPAVLETCLYADDLEAAGAFYEAVIGLTPVMAEAGRHRFLRAAGGMVFLFNPAESERPPGGSPLAVPPHGARGPGHVCFSADPPGIEAWRARFAAHGVEVETEVRWPNGARSLYVRDPAGNSVEVAEPRIWGL